MFLRYVVEQTLAGRSGEIKEYVVGVEVFGRGNDFDPRLDSIVRVEARKVRTKLAEYYASAGARDPVSIELPKGSYAPLIVERQVRPTLGQHPDHATSVAVLPFANIGSDADTEYFADGLTEELIHALGSTGRLLVVARTSVFQFKGKAGDVREIGTRLGAAHVVEGSVRKAGDKLRVTAQLTVVESGYQLWSWVYDRTVTDVFAIQTELAQAIATALGQRIGVPLPSVPVEPEPRSLEAYRAYLRARFHRHQWTADGIAKSVEWSQRALELEPDYAEALAGLSEVLVLSTFWANVDPRSHIEKGREIATRALSISPSLVQPHVVLAWIHMIYDWQWEAAEREVQRALELNPGSVDAYHALGFVYAVTGRCEEASQTGALMLQLDPLSLLINTHVATLTYFRRDYAAAEAQLLKVLSMDRNFAEAHWILAWMNERQGRYQEALHHLGTAASLGGDNPYLLSDVGCVYALTGETVRAHDVVRQLESTFRRPHAAATAIAHVHLFLGELEQAYHWVDTAFEVKDTMVPWICIDPRYDALWSHPGLDDLRKGMGLLQASVNR
jgi:TolB-like protein/Flp pilus assembly protein TadD